MSGGSSDTELNELTVRPIGSPFGAVLVTMVMPVTKLPNVSRKERGLMVCSGVEGRALCIVVGRDSMGQGGLKRAIIPGVWPCCRVRDDILSDGGCCVVLGHTRCHGFLACCLKRYRLLCLGCVLFSGGGYSHGKSKGGVWVSCQSG